MASTDDGASGGGVAGAEARPSRRPEDSAFKQQRLAAWQPVLTPPWVIAFFAIVGIVFVPVGVKISSASDNIVEYSITYDGDGLDAKGCEITKQDQGKTCSVQFDIDEEMDGPVYVYYELDNFYQNHRRYVKSRSPSQLRGETSGLKKGDVKTDCDPQVEDDDDNLLYPCGLIANSMFNDVYTLNSSMNGNGKNLKLEMDETNIAWKIDVDDKFKQLTSFKKIKLSDTGEDNCTDYGNSLSPSKEYETTTYDGETWCYYYPDNDKTTYLYEVYPDVVNPIEGVENEHFIVWMRTAALPDFRKLYGKIHSDIPKGSTLTFDILANFDTSDFDGSKTIVLTTLSWLGGKNSALGVAFVSVGAVALVLATAFTIKYLVAPRKVGDTSLLKFD